MNNELKELLTKEYQEKFPKKDFIPGITSIPVSGKSLIRKRYFNDRKQF